jgi:succinyl-diaminopimelate desuccinylase
LSFTLKVQQHYRSRVTQNSLNPHADVVTLTSQLIDIPSVSGYEKQIADLVESSLRGCSWLTVERLNNNVVARTNLGRSTRVIVAGHLDTVPVADNDKAVRISAGQQLPVEGSTVTEDVLFGLGSCDMKGGVAVALRAAVTVEEPVFDVTYIFYECEEIESARNGLTKIAAEKPDWLKADIAVLLEPSNSNIEAGCQGTLRAQIRTSGVRAHSARSWMGKNAIHGLADALTLLSTYESLSVDIDGLEYREGLNAVGISGGIAGNVIPDEAVLEVNFRYAPNRSSSDAEKFVKEYFKGYDVTIVDNASGALPGLDRPALQSLITLVGGNVAPKYGWTDVARFSAMGVPAVNMGPGNPAVAHARHEHVLISQLISCEELITRWLRG